MNGAGNFVVSWSDSVGGNIDIWAATYNADGTLRAAAAILAVTGDTDYDYAIATTTNGNFVVVYTEPQDNNLQAAIYTADLIPVAGPIAVNITNEGDVGTVGPAAAATEPGVTMDSAGNFYVVWRAGTGQRTGTDASIFLHPSMPPAPRLRVRSPSIPVSLRWIPVIRTT